MAFLSRIWLRLFVPFHKQKLGRKDSLTQSCSPSSPTCAISEAPSAVGSTRSGKPWFKQGQKSHSSAGSSFEEPCAVVPPEIIEQILTFLEGNVSALQSCSLICKRFTHFCQVMIFRRVSLTKPSSNSLICQTLIGSLDRSPQLLHLIKELELYDSTDPTSSHGDSAPPHVLFDPLLPEILHRIKSANFITDFEIHAAGMAWMSLPLDLQRSLTELLQTPSLERFLLEGIAHTPALVLAACRSIRFVDLLMVSVNFAEDLNPGVQVPQLEALNLIIWGLSSKGLPFDLSRLKLAHACVFTQRQPSDLWNTLRPAFGTLEDFRLRLENEAIEGFVFDLSLLTALTTLTLWVEYWTHPTPLKGLSRTLRTLAPTPTLGLITVALTFTEGDISKLPRDAWSWREIDDVLSHSSMNMVKEIRFDFSLNGKQELGFDGPKFIRDVLPQVHDRGVLVFVDNSMVQ